jgi:hypothetical protein
MTIAVSDEPTRVYLETEYRTLYSDGTCRAWHL